MADDALIKRQRSLGIDIGELRVRIRRYSLDPRLRTGTGVQPLDPQRVELLRQTDEAWKGWLALWDDFNKLPDPPAAAPLAKVERSLLVLDRQVDLIQRELISSSSFGRGVRTIAWLAAACVGLALLYLVTHGVHSWDVTTFEPLPESGPMKYFEVAFWSTFGVLCWLMYLAAHYLQRRDFDEWYQPWYVATALRAPFMTVVLMLIILEFVEWYGEGKWIERYLLEEGNKFYFIVFMSFCLGLSSESTSAIIRELSDAVLTFVQNAVTRVSRRLSTAIDITNLDKR